MTSLIFDVERVNPKNIYANAILGIPQSLTTEPNDASISGIDSFATSLRSDGKLQRSQKRKFWEISNYLAT